MKAAVVTENGVQYKDAPKPQPKAHEILIKVKAAVLRCALSVGTRGRLSTHASHTGQYLRPLLKL